MIDNEAVLGVALAARELRDGDVCFVGIGIPSLAAMAAKRLHAPELVLIYESGAIDANPPVPPLSTGSPATVANTAMLASCLDVFGLLQRGRFDLGVLSAAQVDRFGNLNSTRLNRAGRPAMMLVGSGGAHDIAVLARQLIILMPHEPRRFVAAVDFITSPGIAGPDGHRRGGGPKYVITPRARFSFAAGELTLDAVANGVSAEQAVEGFSWAVPRLKTPTILPPPSDDLYAVCRELVAQNAASG